MKAITAHETETRCLVKSIRLGHVLEEFELERISKSHKSVRRMFFRKMDRHGWKIVPTDVRTNVAWAGALPGQKLYRIVRREQDEEK